MQGTDGQGIGLGNLGLPNGGFPMNARERQRARHDVNTLTAFGVIDSAEEVGLGGLVNQNAPDPPDNPTAKKGKKKGKQKQQSKGKGKTKGGVQKKTIAKTKTAVKTAKATKNKNQGVSVAVKAVKGVEVANPAVISAKKHTLSANAPFKKTPVKNVKKEKAHINKQKQRQQKHRRPEGDSAENRVGGQAWPGKRKTRNHGKRGRQRFAPGADPGEGHLAEQGLGDFLHRPLKAKRGRVVLWRTIGEEGGFGGEANDRHFAVGR